MSNVSQLVSVGDDFSDAIILDFLSLYNFEQAFEKVAQNNGSAGIDEETISLFTKQKKAKLIQLRDEVSTGKYQPFPLKQVMIPKSENKWRELKIPTVRDRIVQQALLNVLTPIFEPSFSHSSFAYRPNLSYINAVETVAQWREQGYHYVLDGDIVQFFDNINHQRLLQELRSGVNHAGILCLIKAWISSPVVTNEGQEILTEKGVPQGAVISPLLANIYLNQFDHFLNQTDLKLVRYADDFLILATTQERIIQAYLEIYNLLNSFGLELHSEKSEITNFQRGFRFLGHGFLLHIIKTTDLG